MNALSQWFDDRTGLVSALGKCRERLLPGGPGLRYVLPSALLFAFLVEAVTGVVLWMFYSAGAQSAWESVYWIQERVMGGWLLRAIHAYAGHLMVVLAILWLLQLVVTRMYRAPREFVFWVALLIFFTLLGLLLTGDLLRWDEEGVTATQVRARFTLLLPLIGGEAYKIACGGPDFGNLTVTRFLGLHAGVLSIVLLLLVLANCLLVARHGLVRCCEKSPSPPAPFCPNQAAINTVVWLLLLVGVLVVVLLPAFQGDHAGQRHGEYLGAPLGAPAEPGSAYPAARPEWAFLALYQFAHLFPGELALIPIFIVPGILALVAFLMPLVGRWSVGHGFNLLFTVGLLAAAGYLSWMCVRNDRADAGHQAALAEGQRDAERVKVLVRAASGVPVSGARTLLRQDPKTEGPRLFLQYCASCHSHADSAGQGIVAEKPSAPNLYGFASRQWLAGLLDPKQIVGPDYFGGTAFKSKSDMIGFVKENFADMNDEEKADRLAAIAAISAEAGLKSQRELDAKDAALIKKGRIQITEGYGCVDCHKFHDKGRIAKCPDLTGYGSREWLVAIISNPAHKRFYGARNDRMPIYAESPDQPEKNMLSLKSIEILADWLRGEWFEPPAR